jgi:hypothetical protein
MIETPQQYTARILDYSKDKDPLDVLATTPSRLRELTHGRSRADLTRKSAPERWSIAQILAHLADAEVVGAWRFRAVLAQDGVPLQAYDQNAWASTFRYEETNPADSLDLFDVLRRSTVRLLKSVDPALHENAGLHEERGRESVTHLIRLYAGHDLNHVSQIERLLAGTPQSSPR